MRAILLAALVALNFVAGVVTLKAGIATEGESPEWEYPWGEEDGQDDGAS